MRASALLFDKDGTLFGYQDSWAAPLGGMIADLSGGDDALLALLADAVGFDLSTRQVRPESVFVAESTDVLARCILPHLPHHTERSLIDYFDTVSGRVRLVPAVPLSPLLDRLAGLGAVLGLATNDSEASARAHLREAGVADRFGYVAGYDSGHGAKPGPGMCLAFAERSRLAPDRVVMVGDSAHDMAAGRAAGMQCVAVLTGTASAADLMPHADAVLPDIGHLPAWLGQ